MENWVPMDRKSTKTKRIKFLSRARRLISLNWIRFLTSPFGARTKIKKQL